MNLIPRRNLRLLLTFVTVFCGALWAGQTVSAQDWAEKMFKVKKHDFGSVAKGSESIFRFEFENIYEEDLHIASVRTSCKCTVPALEKRTLKTWEKSAVVANFNTRAFSGKKQATITVVFDQPFKAEVQLSVSGNIRGDIVIEPGYVDFGSVHDPQDVQRVVNVTRFGFSNFQIQDVLSFDKNLLVELREVSRHSQKVNYQLKIKLKDSIACGDFKSELLLDTNERASKRIPIRVRGNVLPPISVSPAKIDFGTVRFNSEKSQRIYLRGKKEFRILETQCKSDLLEISVKRVKPTISLVLVKIRTGSDFKDINEPVFLKTSLDEKVLEVPVSAQISNR